MLRSLQIFVPSRKNLGVAKLVVRRGGRYEEPRRKCQTTGDNRILPFFFVGLCTGDHKILMSRLQASLVCQSAGSLKANGREPKSCLGRVFNFKLGHFASKQHKCMAHMQPLLELKTRPSF